MVSWKIFQKGKLFVLSKLTKKLRLRFPIGLTRAYGIFIYPGSGSVDGDKGEHIIVAPPYNITDAEVDLIVERMGKLVEDFFASFVPSTSLE